AGRLSEIRYGTLVRPADTEAATAAIDIGEACTVPCPKLASASPTTLAGSGTDPKKDGNPASWSCPIPRLTAAPRMRGPDSLSRSLTKAVLHDSASASNNRIRPTRLRGKSS